MRHELVADAGAGEAAVADEGAAEPDPARVLDVVVLLGREAEGVRRAAVLVVDDLGPVALEAHVGGVLGVVVAVRRGRDHLDLAALDEDHDVLPVVPVAARVGDVLDGDVLFEVVVVDVGAPVVVAPRAHVDVVVVEVRGIPAPFRPSGVVVVQALGYISVRINGRSIVAAIGIAVVR